MSSEPRLISRSQLFEAAQRLGLPIRLRKVDEFPSWEDTLLYAETEAKEAMVFVCEDVTWGPALSSYVKPADEYWDRPLLNIEVPNTLDGRLPEIMDALRQWFSD